MPIQECFNHTEGEKGIFQVVDSQGQVLNTNDIGYPSYYAIPGLEVYFGKSLEDVKKELPKLVSEKPFDNIEDYD